MAALVPHNPPYYQSYLPEPSRRHRSIAHVVFTAWAAEAVRRLKADERLHIDSRAYRPARCVTLHMYDLHGDFRCHMNSLYDMLWALFGKRGCKDMIGIIGVATTCMTLPEIKLLSYKGACYHRGYWSDPGNFVYYLFWLLLGQMAKHVRKYSEVRENVLIGDSVKKLQCMVRKRWPRDADSKQWCELVGDSLEMALGCGYIDEQRYWGVIADISPIIFKIREVVEHIDSRGAFARIGENYKFFRGSAAPYARKLSVSMYHAMLVHKYKITSQYSGNVYIGFLEVATFNRLMYGNPEGS